MTNIQEQAVITAIQDGNHEQYRYLVERYHRGLIQHLYNFMHDVDDAEDVAQEAFIRAYDKLSQYDSTYAFSTWLYKIADSIAYRHLKQIKRTVDVDEFAEVLADDKPMLNEITDSALARQRVADAVAKLSTEYRQVVTLYYWDGFSYEDIATITEHPIGTVRTWLYRAKEQLRKELYGQV
ncbi:MAG TPA: RNA polymerase sigma factor [Candidatus Chromulinivoraceae bacterium]|nr:RNA polymerase sigma factor [Candidatus Chromulinivoraceae bacterium]